MKNIIILVISLLLSATTLKATEVPDVVEKAFAQKFPIAKKVKWHKEKDNNYEASFMLNDKETSAVYSPDGQLKETETEISASELPKAVSEAFAKKYPNAKIEETAKIERSGGAVIYEIEVKGQKTDLLFDESGNETK